MTFSRSSLTPVVLIVIAATTAAVLCTLSGAALAQAAHPPEHRLGDHPAVVVQRLQRQAGYDYAAQFYPHPAWLWLVPAPDDGSALASGTAASGVAPPASAPVTVAGVRKPVSAPR